MTYLLKNDKNCHILIKYLNSSTFYVNMSKEKDKKVEKKTENIREFVWKIINTDISVKKNLARNIINTRALAKHIIRTQKINTSLDSVISAIRRYQNSDQKKENDLSIYNMLKQARINIRTKMSALLLKRTDEVKTILGRPDKIIGYLEHEIIRVIEGKETLLIVFDQKNFDKILNIFPKKVHIKAKKRVGMIEINYPLSLEKTPGVFNTISSELAENNISIIDAVITSNEHIIIIKEDELNKAFETLYNLCK